MQVSRRGYTNLNRGAQTAISNSLDLGNSPPVERLY